MSSEFGNKIKLSIFGESHGEAIGCVIDSIPAGVKLDMKKKYFDMARRAPGKDKTATPRLEKDIPHILSGVLNGVTTGAPLAMIIENTNTKSGDYSNLLSVPRQSMQNVLLISTYLIGLIKLEPILSIITNLMPVFVRFLSALIAEIISLSECVS